jgi:hypothetical protein
MTEKPADFLAPRAFAGEPPSPPRPKKARFPFRYVLPAVVFVIVVGAIAWITQFMPNWRVKTGNQPPINGPTAAKAINFAVKKAIWDPEDEAYALETERGHDGHFDFPFENLSGQPAEIGLLDRSCDCSHLEVCLVPPLEWEQYRKEIDKNPLTAKPGNWTWEMVPPNNTKGFEVPADAKGLVRVGWEGRKGPGSRLNLRIKVWHQPLGNVAQRDFEDLDVPIVMAAPLMFSPPRDNLGTLVARDSAVARFTLWSATRDAVDLKWGDADDPRFVYDKKPFSSEECRELEKKLRKEGANTRVHSAFHFQVTVNEQAGGKQLDQGPFTHDVSFLLDDDKVRGPQVLGVAKGEGDVIVGNTEDRGKVDMKIFRAKDGHKRVVPLWTENQILLEPESQTPATLQVKLEQGERTGSRTKWLLEVTVPPSTQFGVFPEESVIILRIKSTPPRFIRIPVTGNGQS